MLESSLITLLSCAFFATAKGAHQIGSFPIASTGQEMDPASTASLPFLPYPCPAISDLPQ